MGIFSGQREGTHIKLGVSAGKMAPLKTYLASSDGADYPGVHGLRLSLGSTRSGKCEWDWSGTGISSI